MGRPFSCPRAFQFWPNRGRVAPVVGEIIGAIFLGIVAGYLARLLVPGKQDIGFLKTVALGIGGALVGYFLFAELLGIGDDDKFDFGGIIGAIIGTMIVLLIWRAISGRMGGGHTTHTGSRPV